MTMSYPAFLALCFLAGVGTGSIIAHIALLIWPLSPSRKQREYEQQKALREEIGQERIERLKAGLPPLR